VRGVSTTVPASSIEPAGVISHDEVYGIPLRNSAVLVDQNLCEVVDRAIRGYQRAYERHHEAVADGLFANAGVLGSEFLEDAGDVLGPVRHQVIPPCLKMLRPPSRWLATGLVEGERRPISEGAWNYIEPPVNTLKGCIAWLRGSPELAGVQYDAVRIRPRLPMALDQALVAFGPVGALLDLLDVQRRGDTARLAEIRLRLGCYLFHGIQLGIYCASHRLSQGVRALVEPATVGRYEPVGITASDVMLDDGSALKGVQVWLPDPFARPSAPVAVSVAAWPRPRPAHHSKDRGGPVPGPPETEDTPTRRYERAVIILKDLAEASPTQRTHNGKQCRALCPKLTSKQYTAARRQAFSKYPAWCTPGVLPRN
jgi:hypothetical protein